MNDFFPEEPKKLKERISRYKRKLKADTHDGAGSRYLIGPMYQLLGDNEAALEFYKWFDKVYDDDIGEPYMSLCWALALHRKGHSEEAKAKLQKTMFDNLFLIPHLLGRKLEDPGIWLSFNLQWQDYAEAIPRELLRLWTDEDKKWAISLYDSPEFVSLRTRYIEINRKINELRPGPERSALIKDSLRLRSGSNVSSSRLSLV